MGIRVTGKELISACENKLVKMDMREQKEYLEKEIAWIENNPPKSPDHIYHRARKIYYKYLKQRLEHLDWEKGYESITVGRHRGYSQVPVYSKG